MITKTAFNSWKALYNITKGIGKGVFVPAAAVGYGAANAGAHVIQGIGTYAFKHPLNTLKAGVYAVPTFGVYAKQLANPERVIYNSYRYF